MPRPAPRRGVPGRSRRPCGGLMAEGDTAIADEVLAEDYLDHDIPGVGEGGRRDWSPPCWACGPPSLTSPRPSAPPWPRATWLLSGSRHTAATPAPRSRPVSPPPASPSPGRKLTSSAARAGVSPSTGGVRHARHPAAAWRRPRLTWPLARAVTGRRRHGPDRRRTSLSQARRPSLPLTRPVTSWVRMAASGSRPSPGTPGRNGCKAVVQLVDDRGHG